MFFFFQAEDGIRDYKVTGVQTCALPISSQENYVSGCTATSGVMRFIATSHYMCQYELHALHYYAKTLACIPYFP